jgi:hypothetical protein
MNELRLASDQLEVVVTPAKGCDIVGLIDRASGIDLLFKPPWRARGGAAPGTHHATSASQWLERYAGGWQVLLPNGGTASVEHGVEWGFHGEACLVPWEVEAHDATSATLSTDLFRAPLSIERVLEVDGPVLRIEETVTNTSPDSIEVMWSHHPAFGAPFLDGGCLLTTGARTYLVDGEVPGTMLAPRSRHAWPVAELADGTTIDLGSIPAPAEARAHLGYLTEFDAGWFALTNPALELGVAFRWPLEVFPAAWFWQEIHSTSGYPWYRRAYVTAVEPCTTFPGHGLAHARAEGGSPFVLAGHDRASVTVEAVVFHDRRPVAATRLGGPLEFAT